MALPTPNDSLTPAVTAAQELAQVDPDYQGEVERATHLYIAMTSLSLMGNGLMERACVSALEVGPEAIAMAYDTVTDKGYGRVIPAPPGGRWIPGPAFYPLSKAEQQTRQAVLDIAAVVMPREVYPTHHIHQLSSDVSDW